MLGAEFQAHHDIEKCCFCYHLPNIWSFANPGHDGCFRTRTLRAWHVCPGAYKSTLKKDTPMAADQRAAPGCFPQSRTISIKIQRCFCNFASKCVHKEVHAWNWCPKMLPKKTDPLIIQSYICFIATCQKAAVIFAFTWTQCQQKQLDSACFHVVLRLSACVQ